VRISDSGKQAQLNESAAIDERLNSADNDPTLRLIRAMVEILTGRTVAVFDASTLPPGSVSTEAPTTSDSFTQPANGLAVEYTRHESYTELEQSSFHASGSVQTTDGQEINFSITLKMSRSFRQETDFKVAASEARPTKDPLVLNFHGATPQLTSQRFSFDLDADGANENINFVAGGSGFLVFDRNGDGKINNGRELFGALSGNGFAELAALDSDNNGWIDEGDAAYAELGLWTKNATGADQLTPLSQAGVGALSVASVATPFSLKTTDNQLQAEMRSTGIYLNENGSAGTLQQIDLTV